LSVGGFVAALAAGTATDMTRLAVISATASLRDFDTTRPPPWGGWRGDATDAQSAKALVHQSTV
jgi:hypothetical protein